MRKAMVLGFVLGLVTAPGASAAGIIIGTGGESGVYHATGKAICGLIAKSGGTSCDARSSGGSIRNLQDLAAGRINFAMAQSDWQFHAYRGSSKWNGDKIGSLRSVFSVYSEAVQIVAKDGISKWHDLKGKRVNIGNPGSGQRETMEEMMSVQGWRAKSFAPASEAPSSEHVALFCAGKIDAFVHVIGIPNAAMAKAVGECSGRIIEPGNTVIRKLVTAARPYYSRAVIPAGTYKKSQPKVDTFAVMATLVTVEGTDSKLVETLLDAVFGDFDAFKAMHPSFAGADPKGMVADGLSAPPHPAAEAFYKAKGWK